MSIGDARFFTRSGPHSIATVAEAAGGTTPETDLLLTGVAPLQAAGPDEVSSWTIGATPRRLRRPRRAR